MAFKKGDKKPPGSGRKKGVKNKNSCFRESIEATGFNVAEEAVKLYREKKLPPSIKLALLELIASYSFAKPKPIEDLTDPIFDVPEMSDEDAIAAVLDE